MTPTTNESSPEEAGDQIFFEPLLKSARALFGLAHTPQSGRRLYRAMNTRRERLNLDTFSEYAARLRRDPEEWKNVWPLALSHEGSFFRPAAQFEVARDLLTEWAVMAPERTLRVLSLGCGPGYETASLAMMLEETGLRAKNWQVDIYGLDLNEEAVARAENGVFSEDDLNWLTPAQRKKWFTPRVGGFHFKSELAPPVHLAVGNLHEFEEGPFGELTGTFDLIFARELTYEATPDAIGELDRLLRLALAPVGFIFTAPGEFLPGSSGDLTLEERSGVTYYRRGARRIKLNRHHQPKRPKDGAVRRPDDAAVGEAPLPPRERALLDAAEKELAEGRPEAARTLANEVMLSALDDNRASPAAWALLAGIEKALGRPEMAEAIIEVIGASERFSG